MKPNKKSKKFNGGVCYLEGSNKMGTLCCAPADTQVNSDKELPMTLKKGPTIKDEHSPLFSSND